MIQNYWINAKLLNEHRIIEKMQSCWMNMELLNEYKVVEWIYN